MGGGCAEGEEREIQGQILELPNRPRELCLCADRVVSGWQERVPTARNIISGPSPGREETTRGNSESSVRLRSWSLRTGAGKPRRGQEVGSRQDLWASRACWGQEIHYPWALSHHRERGMRDWKGLGSREGEKLILARHLLSANYCSGWFTYTNLTNPHRKFRDNLCYYSLIPQR